MIQRKQSLWLLLAALVNCCILFLDLYRWHESNNGTDVLHQLKVTDHFPSLLLVLVMTALPAVTVFMYRQRKRQINMSLLSILVTAGFIALMLVRVSALGSMTPPPLSGSYWVGSVLPVISLVFIVLAIVGIRKDDKLVKSMDRLR